MSKLIKALLFSIPIATMSLCGHATLATLSIASEGCGVDPFPICGCLVVWYNAECPSPDPMSTGWDDLGFPPGVGIEAAVQVVQCPNSGNLKDDAGKLSSAASSEMEKAARDATIKRQGLLTDGSGNLVKMFNAQTGRSSFVKVVQCTQFTRADIPDGAPRPSKDWFRYHSKQRPGMGPTPPPQPPPPADAGPDQMGWDFGGCDPISIVETADGTFDITFWSDCPLNIRGDEDEAAPDQCKAVPTCPSTPPSSACDECARQHCCPAYNNCLCGQEQCGTATTPQNACTCRFECETVSALDNCQSCADSFGDPKSNITVQQMAGCVNTACSNVCTFWKF